MQVLLVTDKMQQHEEVMIAYMKAGFQITATSSVKVAETFCRFGAVDLLIIAEKLAGKLTHATALLAEHQNPLIATILLTDRTDEAADEVFELIPSVHSCVGTEVAGDLIMQLGRASVESVSKAQFDQFAPSPAMHEPEELAQDVLVEPEAPVVLHSVSMADAA